MHRRRGLTAPPIHPGAAMLTFTTMAVTVADADAYATARGLAGWTGTTPDKTAALRRGQDYIAGRYNNRWLVSFTDATAPDAVKYAITEAALRELRAPNSLAPDYVAADRKVLTEVKGIKWQVVGDAKDRDAQRPTISVIEYLLTGIASIDPLPGILVV